MYHNAELGFRYQFPKSWIVNDRATQDRAVAARRQFVWGDYISAKREREAEPQCTQDLLFVTRYPEEMRLNQFNPFAFLIAADPKCAPGVTFPKTVKDNEAIQRIASALGVYFKTADVTSRSSTRIRAFNNDGRVMLEISQSFSITTREPGRTTFFHNIRSSVLLMQASEYWVMLMFASDDDVQLEKLRATKIFLDGGPAEPAESK